MNERALRFRLGLFVLIALVLLATLIVMFGSFGTARWFRRATPYTITFAEAPGLATGTPVRRSGVRVGEVTDVSLDDETGQVKVAIAIDKRYTIRKHEKPMLSTSVIGGDTVIDFVPEKQDPNKPPLDKSPVPAGTTIPGEAVATVSTLLAKASEVVPTTQELMNDIRKSLQSLEKMTPSVESTLKEFRDLAKEVRTIVPDVKKSAEEIRKLATSLSDASPDFREATRELQKLLRSANDAFPEVRKTNKDVQEFLKQATEVMPDLKTAVRDVGATAQQYNKLGESLDKLVKDNQTKVVRIIDNFNATIDRTMDLLSNENRRNVTDTLRNIKTSTDRLPETSKNLDEAMKEGKETAKQLRETLKKADEVLINLRDFTRSLADSGPSLIRNLDQSLDKTNKVLGDMRELMRVLGESDGTFRRFLTDPSLYNHLDEAVFMAGRAMPRLDRILKDLETFADKLARHPEAIGLGGVVKPGSGLKDPPSPYPGPVIPPGP
jgi:ABC-type transporter Mla subunit MlaD